MFLKVLMSILKDSDFLERNLVGWCYSEKENFPGEYFLCLASHKLIGFFIKVPRFGHFVHNEKVGYRVLVFKENWKKQKTKDPVVWDYLAQKRKQTATSVNFVLTIFLL